MKLLPKEIFTLYKKAFSYLFFLLHYIFGTVPVKIHNPRVFSYIYHYLPLFGKLRQTHDGFLYIDLPNQYIFELIPLMHRSKVSPPPYFENGKVGAHITVATAEEIAGLNFPSIPYLGKTICFSVTEFTRVPLEGSDIGSKAYMLLVNCPKVEEIRSKLGLSQKIKGYDFHITVAIEKT